MDRSAVLAMLLFVLIFAQGSDGSLLGNFRKVVGMGTEKKYKETQISPSPAPISESPQDPPVPENSIKVDPSGSDIKDPERPQTENHGDKGTNQEDMNDICEALPNRCTDVKGMVACLRSRGNDAQELFLFVQNKGESTLKVNVSVPASVKISTTELEIPKNEIKKINVSVNVGESPEIVLNAGNGECRLHTGVPVSEGNLFQWIPSYATFVTPIYGAYFLFLIALIIGGTWACCKFRKWERRSDSGIPYQELEMGMPGSNSVVNVETTDGWDQGWDDDWDEEKAVKSPGGRHVGNVSANGLTSRSSNRDGWEKDWDD